MKHLKPYHAPIQESCRILPHHSDQEYVDKFGYTQIMNQLDDYLTELSDEGYELTIGLTTCYLDIHNSGILTPYLGIQIVIPDVNYSDRDFNRIRSEYIVPTFNRLNLGSGWKLIMVNNYYKSYRAFIFNVKALIKLRII